MATYTPNYNLSKPESTDTQASLVSAYRDNMDIIDKQMGNKNIAEEYDNTQTYAVDDYVIYDGDLYKCTTVVSSAEDFDPAKWTQTLVVDEMGSGGGDVVDVEVNGISVVDAGTKIAEITSYEEVTIAEYESIPVAERESNGIAYFIKDLNNSNVEGYPPLIYSDEEREIGVWRDGKPLYQKTIEFGALPNNATKNVAHGISNLENIVNIISVARNTTSNNIIHIPHVHRSTVANQIQVSCDTTNVTVITATNSTQFDWCYFTLQYTKTTDTAGSGSWTPMGTQTHHYSTDEQVVGTWIDGKPLYERILSLTFTAVTSSTYTFSTEALDHPKICSIEKIFSEKFGTLNFASYGNQLTAFDFYIEMTSGSDFGKLAGWTRRSDMVGFPIYAVCQYTKTTD